jgi:hypothetical protein
MHDGPKSGGLRWSTLITSTMTGDHAASPDVGALSRERNVASRGGVPRNPHATVGLPHGIVNLMGVFAEWTCGVGR